MARAKPTKIPLLKPMKSNLPLRSTGRGRGPNMRAGAGFVIVVDDGGNMTLTLNGESLTLDNENLTLGD